jgi:hypothetical protein
MLSPVLKQTVPENKIFSKITGHFNDMVISILFGYINYGKHPVSTGCFF